MAEARSWVACLLDPPPVACLELERGMLDVEVPRQAPAQLIEHVGGHRSGREHDVCGDNRQAAGDRPGVQVVDVRDPCGAERVPADRVEVNAIRRGLQQDVGPHWVARPISDRKRSGSRPVQRADAIIAIGGVMATSQLIVRGLDEATVRALKRRAARHGRSAEAEHREILREALAHEQARPPFKDLLRAMPDVGEDADFARSIDLPRDVEL